MAPGLVDLHTHLREPGFDHKETVETGTRSAALGGFTAVAPMANTDPVADSAAVIHEVRDLAARAGLADVFPVGAITKGSEGETLSEMGEMVAAGVRVFSDDGRCVPTARMLRNALTYARACHPCSGKSGSLVANAARNNSARTTWLLSASRY